jgi:hypothetical protein
VYGTTIIAALTSYLLIGSLVVGLRVQARLAHLAIAALSGGIYYWYAGPAIAAHLTAAPWASIGIRTAGIALVGSWLLAALRTTAFGDSLRSTRSS